MTDQPANSLRLSPVVALSAMASLGLHGLLFFGLSRVDALPSELPRAASRLDASGWSEGVPLAIAPPEPLPIPTPEVAPAPPPPPPPPSAEEPIPEERLGIEESNQDTKNWLGVADPTEHHAPQFETEQPSWSPQPGVPMAPGNAPTMGAAAPLQPAAPPEDQPEVRPENRPEDRPEPTPPTPPDAPDVRPDETPDEIPDAPIAPEAHEATTAPTEGPAPLPAAAESTRGVADGTLEPADAPLPDTAPPAAAPPEAPIEPTPDPFVEAPPQAPKGDGATTIEQDGRIRTDEPIDDAEPVQFSSQHMAPLAEQAALLAPLPFTPPMAAKVADAVLEATRVATSAGTREGTPDANTPDAATPPVAAPDPTNLPMANGGQAGAPVPPGARPAEVNESDSTPTSRLPAINVKLGRPAAGQGLEVITVRPHFSVTSLLTTNPQKSSINVIFGRDGTVLKATFVEGKTTGYTEVDGPLLDAVYRWRAKGKALMELPTGRDPSKGLLVTFHIEL